MKEQNQLLIQMEKKLSVFQGYEGWMIGKVSVSIRKLKKNKEKTPPVFEEKLIKKSSKLAILHVFALDGQFEGELKVTLTAPYLSGRSQEKAEIIMEQHGSILKITQEEVSAFTELVKDHNPIHRGNSAIVPGLLIMNALLSNIDGNIKADVRFLHPLKTGEAAVLETISESSGMVTILGNFNHVPLFSAHICKEKMEEKHESPGNQKQQEAVFKKKQVGQRTYGNGVNGGIN